MSHSIEDAMEHLSPRSSIRSAPASLDPSRAARRSIESCSRQSLGSPMKTEPRDHRHQAMSGSSSMSAGDRPSMSDRQTMSGSGRHCLAHGHGNAGKYQRPIRRTSPSGMIVGWKVLWRHNRRTRPESCFSTTLLNCICRSLESNDAIILMRIIIKLWRNVAVRTNMLANTMSVLKTNYSTIPWTLVTSKPDTKLIFKPVTLGVSIARVLHLKPISNFFIGSCLSEVKLYHHKQK